MTVVEIVKDWWPMAAALVAGAFGIKVAHERTRWKISEIERRLTEIEREVEFLNAGRSADAVTLGIIQTTLEQIKGMLADLREDVKQKADK